MTNKTTQEQLIELYEQQIQDLVMMSKIELGDDVIAKIKELKSQINKQQTAVEYLVEQLKRIGFSTNNLIEFENEVIIAKEMEKEQHENTWYAGDEDGVIFAFEYYWNETYGGNK